jgi:hypothetical protein
MKSNPDIFLLYEYMKKISFTVRVKLILDEPVDGELLYQAAQEAIKRFPYFSVSVGLDGRENYFLAPNTRPLPVLPEKDRRLMLGSAETNGHLFAITWRGDTVYFNWSHAICGAFGAMRWIKTTLYQYLTKKYGEIEAPADLKRVDSPVAESELYYPDPESLPKDEPISRYTGTSSNIALPDTLKYILNPFARDSYYYQIDIPKAAFMAYNKDIDASPNSIIAAIMYKVCTQLYTPKDGTHVSARIPADFRADIGCPDSYRDFIRYIHVKYDWELKDEPIEKLNLRARGELIRQNQPELSCEVFRQREKLHEEIDALPDLKAKKAYASKHSIFRTDVRDPYTISYVGNMDWGGMAEHIKGVYTITDGDLMLEVNALPDKFCITFQRYTKKPEAVKAFCAVLEEEKLPYTVSQCMIRYLPDIRLPKP